MNFNKLVLASISFVTGMLMLVFPLQAKVEGDKIILGSAISLTGKYATNGLHAQRGYDFAVERINSMGGVKVGGKTYMLSIKYYDDESTPARGAQLAERLIKQDGVEFMLGPYSSGLTKAIAPVTEKYGVPMVEAEGASRSLFTQGYRYLFAVLSTSEQYLSPSIDHAASMAKKNGKNPSSVKVAMAFENDPFSLDVREGVVDTAKKYGMKIVIDDKLPADLSDMSSTLTKVKAMRPDILLVSGHSKGAATAARQIGEMRINVPLISITHCEAAKVHEKFPKAAQGFLCPTPNGLQMCPTVIPTLEIPKNMTGNSKRLTRVIVRFHIKRHRHLQPFLYGSLLLKQPIPLTKTDSVMRFLQPKQKRFMERSSFLKQETTLLNQC